MIRIFSSDNLDNLLQREGKNSYGTLLSGGSYKIPENLEMEILNIRYIQGIYVLDAQNSRDEINVGNIIKRFGGEKSPSEAFLSTRWLNDYLGSTDGLYNYILAACSASILIKNILMKYNDNISILSYISGSCEEDKKWMHSYRFHVRRNLEYPWFDPVEFTSGSAVPKAMHAYSVAYEM